MGNIPYLLALHSIDGLGPIRLKAILNYFKDPRLAWEANIGVIREIGIPQNVADLLAAERRKLDPALYAESIKKAGISWLTIFDEHYPYLLKQIYDPPVVIYYKGQIKKDEKAIAVVGTRKITGYGRAVTEQFVKRLVDGGLTIVSGLARGIDAEAHLSTIRAGGRTIAVLGGGLKNIYPPENRSLAERIIDRGGLVLSEFPPDYPSMPGNFPARNRIISGLSLGVLVVEAAEDSGSLITARIALEQGREVFAVPGPVTSTLSRGPVDLMKEGARPIFDPQEILEEMGFKQNQNSNIKNTNDVNLSEEEKKILEYLGNEQLHMDEICRNLKMSAAQVSGTLLKMEIAGLVQNLGNGTYCRI
ncbi:DNA-protecting protein DprA [Candidatus Daviesbacteria bacterium]|nr:DNA-protecting protein DprA [Candidatus Daviesbacteria bacterium]